MSTLHTEKGLPVRVRCGHWIKWAAAPLMVLLSFPVMASVAGATPVSGTLQLASYDQGGQYVVTLTVPSTTGPTGTVTISDNLGGSCQSSSWNSDATDDFGSGVFEATCTISTAEPIGTNVSASYSGSDYSATTSNVLASAPELSGSVTPFVGSAGSYTATATMTLTVPHGDLAPTGEADAGALAYDNVAFDCGSSAWSGPAVSGVYDVYTTNCALTSSSHWNDGINYLYLGSDYSPIASTTDNDLTLYNFSGTLAAAAVDLPWNDVAPTGVLTISDSDGQSCTAGWTDE